MTASQEIEHGSEALRWLASADPAYMTTGDKIGAAQVHATLANTVMLREIRDELRASRQPAALPANVIAATAAVDAQAVADVLDWRLAR